jgi:hypothetical protein
MNGKRLTFTFDHVFDAHHSQADVYDGFAGPLLQDLFTGQHNIRSQTTIAQQAHIAHIAECREVRIEAMHGLQANNKSDHTPHRIQAITRVS